MTGDAKLAALLVFLVAELTRGVASYDVLTRDDPCMTMCETMPTEVPIISLLKKSCCQRGCRFFNLVDLRSGWESNNLNGTKDACDASCLEAYADSLDRYLCYVGCAFMAKQRSSDLLALFSISVHMKKGLESNILLVPDIPENDILTDPGLRKELLPGWWDTDGFKLPQTYIKTVPMDAGTVDYALSSDYSGETEQAASMTGSDWFHCVLKQIRMPNRDSEITPWLIIAIMGIMVTSLALFLSRRSSLSRNSVTRKNRLIKTSTLPKVALSIPDDMPLYQKPPPKYEQLCEF